MGLFVDGSSSDEEYTQEEIEVVRQEVSETEDENEIENGFKRRKLEVDDVEFAFNVRDETSSDSEFEDINYLKIPIKTKTKRNYHQHKYKQSLHFLGIVAYTSFLYKRNQQLHDLKIQKKLYKLIPKKIRKLIKNLTNDESLIYILKYLLKWFRLNFKVNDTGLRVLGYQPKGSQEYFPKSIPFDLPSIIKNFASNRDVAAQIFNTILKSFGWEARLVFSLPLLSKDSPFQPKVNQTKLLVNKDLDLLYPYFWTELINPLNPDEVIVLESVCFHQEEDRLIRLKRHGDPSLSNFYTDKFYPSHPLNLMTMHWVLAIDQQITDVSPRYMANIAYRYFDKLDLRTQAGRTALLMQTIVKFFNNTANRNAELTTLKKIALINYQIPTTYSAMKRNPNVITPSTLRYNETIGKSTPQGSVTLDGTKQLMYSKNAIIVGKSERQWKYLGRSIDPEQLLHPIKKITNNYATTIHNRRILQFQKIHQPELNEIGLFSYNQTIPYIKMVPTTENGITKLPRNKWGNIEIFHNCMIPDNCQWLKLSNIISIAKLYHNRKFKFYNESFDYVSVLVGFNFSAKVRQAIPLLNGILVFNQDSDRVKKIWLKGKMELLETEGILNRNQSLIGWKTMLRLLRIKQNLDFQYGSLP